MDIEILKSEKRYMEFYIIGEGHTFCNVLRSILAESEHVKRVSYTVEHPITHRLKPRFEIETQGRRRPETALRRAAERLSETCDELSGEFDAALG